MVGLSDLTAAFRPDRSPGWCCVLGQGSASGSEFTRKVEGMSLLLPRPNPWTDWCRLPWMQILPLHLSLWPPASHPPSPSLYFPICKVGSAVNENRAA